MAKMIKKTTAGYVVIQNKIAQCNVLGHYDRGMLVQLLSLPDDWDFSINGLRKLTADGRDSVANSIERLMKAGYIEKREQSRKGGKFSSTVWIIYDEPQIRKNADSSPCTENPLTVNPLSEKPLTEKQEQQNKKKQKKKEQSKNIQKAVPAVKTKCSFHNFHERTYDYAALEDEAFNRFREE